MLNDFLKNLFIFLCVIPAAFFMLIHCSQNVQTGKMENVDALKFDPWYRPSDVGKVIVSRMSRDEIQKLVSFQLAVGPGEEIKVETRTTNWTSTRITYRYDKKRLYRITQYPSGASKTDYVSPYPPDTTYKGMSIFCRDISEEMAPWSSAWWDDPQLGEVELASETLSAADLIQIAKDVIDAKG